MRSITTKPARRTQRARRAAGLAALAMLLAPCAVAQAATVYALGSQTGTTIQRSTAGPGGALSPFVPAIAGASVLTGRGAMAISPDGDHLYALATGAPESIRQFSIGPDGELTPLSPATATVAPGNTGLRGIAITPNGRNAYVTTFGSGTVLQFAVGSDGTLTPLVPASVPAGTAPWGIAVSPDGRGVYVANSTSQTTTTVDGTLSQYSIGPDGGLVPMSPATVDTGLAPVDVAVSPDGRNVYVSNEPINQATTLSGVSQYAVGADGRLAPLAPAMVKPGAQTVQLALDPGGTSVYVGIRSSSAGQVLQYSVGAGGALVAKTPPGVGPSDFQFVRDMAVSADGSSLYVARADTGIAQYSLGTGGLLSLKVPPVVDSGTASSVFGIAVSPLPPATGAALSVRASGSVPLGGSVSAFATLSGAGGASGTITFAVFGPQDTACTTPLATSTATVSGNGPYASAAFTPVQAGRYTWTATYGGDASHAAIGPLGCGDPDAEVSATSGPPAVTTGAASAIGGGTASLAGTVDPGGAPAAYVFEYGTSLAFGAITPPASAGSGTSPAPVGATLSGLASATTYYYRLVATTLVGTATGPVRSFSTGTSAPLAVTGAASQVTNTTATLAGTVNPSGLATAFTIEYGTTSAFGQITPVVALDDAQGAEPVSASVGALQPDTTYLYRVVATNAAGTTFGTVRSFSTGPGGAPLVTTGAASAVTAGGATLAGTVNARGAQTAFTFAYGTTPANLDAITAVDSVGASPGAHAISLPLAGLAPGTTYYYRLVAANAFGSSFALVRSFTTSLAAGGT